MNEMAAPRYQRVKEHILARIQSGELVPGNRVPSENELVDALKVSRMTANRALRELSEAGILDRVPGVGTFVKEPQARASLMELRNIADEITARGHQHMARIISRETVKAHAAIAEEFELPPDSLLHHIVILHHENGLPVQLEERHVNLALAPDFATQDFTRITPTQWLVENLPVDELEHTVEAQMPKPQRARILNINTDEPCLCLHRRSWSGGRIVTVADLIYPASRYALYSRYRTSPTGSLQQRNAET